MARILVMPKRETTETHSGSDAAVLSFPQRNERNLPGWPEYDPQEQAWYIGGD